MYSFQIKPTKRDVIKTKKFLNENGFVKWSIKFNNLDGIGKIMAAGCFITPHGEQDNKEIRFEEICLDSLGYAEVFIEENIIDRMIKSLESKREMRRIRYD